ncbi:MAG: nuclease domain-containing protein [Ignavibacteria bacterium]|nr:nuclease domain-containing protein [Ignavibacteria bacterium]
MPEFEVLLISIDWESPDKFRAIIPYRKFLKASTISGIKYEYDIVLYTKEGEHYFQFAVKTKHLPVLKVNDERWDRINRLYNIQDDLWIIKGEWRTGQRGNGYHYCPSINTVGKIEIGISEDLKNIQHLVTIDINSNIDDFDFSQLKKDFEGELWNLITSNKSNVSSDKIEIRYSGKIFRYPENKSIIEFLKAFDQIAKNPKRELSPTKEIRRIQKVIPIAETYRKLSAIGTATHLPSKAVLENHDIFENRFVCFMLHSIHLILSNNVISNSRKIERLQNEIEVLNQKITILQDNDPKVNEFDIIEEITFQEKRVLDLTNYWKGISESLEFNPHADYQRIKIKIKYPYNNAINNYWGYINNQYCLFWVPNSIAILLKVDAEFLLVANSIELSDITTDNGRTFPRINIKQVKKIFNTELTKEMDILKRQKKNHTILEENKWSQFSILNDHEITKFNTERKNQIQTFKNNIEKLIIQTKNLSDFNDEQSQIHPKLLKRVNTNFFKKIKWKNLQGFKPSMTYIQNIIYRNALRYYKEILKSEGIEIEVFDLYENITSYGLREMPQVYELWCLITQIKVLEENFHFAHNPKDLISLLKIIDPKKQTIAEHSKIDFKNSLAGRRVTLHYQKSIADNKRPDFILEITCNSRTINLVLDSKFKNYNYKKSIVYETMAMTDKYGGNNNYVFILHPCKDGIFEGRNIKYTNHGGERIFYGEGDQQKTKFPVHEYGYIELKPNFTDALKKLIAMSFEYLLESSRNAKQDNDIDPKPENEMFCLNCGGTNISITHLTRGINRHYYNCTCDNTDCGHKIYIDYCWNCKTKLFKHGSYWDYHLESTWSIFDIRCPSCGMTVADRPRTTDFEL